MEIVKNTKITRYVDGNYYFDIVENEDTIEAWIQHKDYGMCVLIYGTYKEADSTEKILKNLKNNLDDYKDDYRERIM